MNKIIIILVIFVMLFSGFTLLENSQTNNFYENKINTNNFISSNSPIYNLTIYIHNSPAGNGYYQQLFNFNSTSYFINNLNQNASNFYISYENGTLIYSWIQNWNFTTKNLSVWSKLQNGTKVIMIEIFNQNTNLLSATGYLGEAPQLSSTYAEYDNGKMVFPFYDNFAGTSLNTSIWNKYGSDNSVSSLNNILVNNGLSLIGGGHSGTSHETWISTSLLTGSFTHAWVVDIYENSPSINTTFRWGFSNTLPTDFDEYNQSYFGEQIYSNGNWYVDTNNGSSSNTQNEIGSWASLANSYVVWSMTANNSKVLFYNPNSYSLLSASGQTINTTIPAYSPSVDLSLTNEYNNPIYVKWARTRTYLPNGMPTYNIELNTYNVNIKSFDKQSNSIHNYFFYNNSVYSANNNTFVFKNKTSFSEISLIPLNFSSYFTEYKNITISQSQFINNNNSYYYNLSIYYYNSNLNTVNPYDFANYIYPISILVFLLLGGIILFGTIKYRRSN